VVSAPDATDREGRVSLLARFSASRRPSNVCSPIIERRKHSIAALCVGTICAASIPLISSVGLMPISTTPLFFYFRYFMPEASASSAMIRFIS
jgi:hypothetical protein